jgi:hypothetical protein
LSKNNIKFSETIIKMFRDTFLKNGHAPNYLRELIPPTVQSTTIYPLRNGSDLIIPFCRLSITTESFIPSTVKLWKKLGEYILSTVFLDFVYLTYILIFAYLNVLIRLRLYFQCGYSI